MSSVSDRMERRRLPSPAGGASDRATVRTLGDLHRGQCARLIGYADNLEPSTARRLFDLGLVPGIEVTVVRRAPMRDPIIYRVGDYEIALRVAQARGIYVEQVR